MDHLNKAHLIPLVSLCAFLNERLSRATQEVFDMGSWQLVWT